MSDEIKSWIIPLIQLVSTAILCPNLALFFERATFFENIVFSLNVLLLFSKFYKKTLHNSFVNAGLMRPREYKVFLIFYYSILGLFIVSQIGSLF